MDGPLGASYLQGFAAHFHQCISHQHLNVSVLRWHFTGGGSHHQVKFPGEKTSVPVPCTAKWTLNGQTIRGNAFPFIQLAQEKTPGEQPRASALEVPGYT